MPNTLYIGNKNYSSWSLRPWLCLKWAGIAFNEEVIHLDQPGYGEGRIAAVLAVNPAGRVPVLKTNTATIWDSLSIAEWAAEQVPQARLWPLDPRSRALARSASAEMHSGFSAVRTHLPMNIKRRCPEQNWNAATRRDLARLASLWSDLRQQFAAEGPWLLGTRTIADAMFAPVVARLRTYSVPLSPIVAAYSATLLADNAFLAWESDCAANSWDRSGYSVIDGMYA